MKMEVMGLSDKKIEEIKSKLEAEFRKKIIITKLKTKTILEMNEHE
jgi:hypothetical protein